MKIYVMSFIIILCTFCQLAAVTLVQEDFNLPTFPPTGWSVEKQGDGNSNWFQEEQQGRICAWGYYYHVNGPPTWAETSLVSNSFTLTANHSCTITFQRFNLASNCPSAVFKVTLRRDSTTVWEQLLSQVYGFTFTELTTPIQTISSPNYKVTWFLYGSGGLNQGNAANFYVDDVIVFYDDTDVLPNSLGCIKASFK